VGNAPQSLEDPFLALVADEAATVAAAAAVA
jgi:hypothetical protein